MGRGGITGAGGFGGGSTRATGFFSGGFFSGGSGFAFGGAGGAGGSAGSRSASTIEIGGRDGQTDPMVTSAAPSATWSAQEAATGATRASVDEATMKRLRVLPGVGLPSESVSRAVRRTRHGRIGGCGGGMRVRRSG